MGKKKPGYLSLEEAIKVVKEMNIRTVAEYQARRLEYPGLPSSPWIFYGESYPGWDGYTSGANSFYPTVEEAKAAVSKLGIENFQQYKVRRREDHRLPLHPRAFYGSQYQGHKDFYGREKVFYPTLAQASEAAIALGIKTSREYAEKFVQDSSLPRHPNKIYKGEWVGWAHFLRNVARRKGQGKYESFSEFTTAVRKLGVLNQREYLEKYKQDPKLPRHPREIYEQEWPGWRSVCAVNPDGNKCETWQEAKQVAAQYWFTSRSDYMDRCDIDPRLPKYPAARYKDFPGWETYLFPDRFVCLNDFKCALRLLGVRSVRQFEEKLALYPSIPNNPMEVFKDEWTGWEDVLGRNYYSFAELSEIAQASGCRTMREYKSLVRSLKDPRMPSSPHTVYEEWENAHKFLSKVEPYTLEFVESNLRGWVSSIKNWFVGVRSAVHKETSLCRFLRHFVGPYCLGETPHEFLLKTGVDVKPFISLLEKQVSQQVGRRLLHHVNEFLNHTLKTELTLEDEETREKIRVNNASNPLAYLEHAVTDSKRPGESVKPALAYQYVERIKTWIVPETAKNFSDLPHIQIFDSDYVEVDESFIDRLDPDCVFREHDGKIYIWCPVHWMHTYALVSIPARGRQIAYNDSGEADEYIADIVNDKIVWAKNTGRLAGWRPALATSRRKNSAPAKGFMQHSGKDWVMNFTSNKTGFNGSGYRVDWAPEALVYWMVKLRKWQEKYNSISRPFPWSECTRTLLNAAQLKAKGANCFLFRGFREEEPPAYSARSTDRLAAALYYSQPKDIVLATFLEGGSRSTLNRYDSKYTPHSMRVSLITAYVMEFGLPIEIVMKLAGHSSMVMSIYYVKAGGVAMRRRMEEGEKKHYSKRVMRLRI